MRPNHFIQRNKSCIALLLIPYLIADPALAAAAHEPSTAQRTETRTGYFSSEAFAEPALGEVDVLPEGTPEKIRTLQGESHDLSKRDQLKAVEFLVGVLERAFSSVFTPFQRARLINYLSGTAEDIIQGPMIRLGIFSLKWAAMDFAMEKDPNANSVMLHTYKIRALSNQNQNAHWTTWLNAQKLIPKPSILFSLISPIETGSIS